MKIKTLAIALPLLAFSGSSAAADYYLDFTIVGSNADKSFLPSKLTKLSLDATSTGRFFSASGAFYSATATYPTTGACVLGADSNIECSLELNIGYISMSIQANLLPSSTGGMTGVITGTLSSGAELKLTDTGALKIDSIRTAP